MYRLHLVVTHPLMDIWAASISGLLFIVLIQTLLRKHLFTILLLILLYTYPEVELLDHMAVLFENFGGVVTLFFS